MFSYTPKRLLMAACFFWAGAHSALADDSLITKKYAYGYGFSRGYISVVDGKPMFYPLLNEERYNFLYPGYLVSSKESKEIQSDLGIDIKLAVEARSGNVQTNVIFNNASGQSFFVHKRYLPDVYKIKNGAIVSELCSQTFLVVTDNSRLDYMGALCDYDYDLDPNSWVEIKSGKAFSFTVDLNRSYIFPPGYRKYNIGTLEYPIVNKKWFTVQNVYKEMFDIFNWKYECRIERPKNYLALGSDCVNDVDNSMEFFLLNLSLSGGNDNIFNVRSNQVVVNINGDDIQSLLKNK